MTTDQLRNKLLGHFDIKSTEFYSLVPFRGDEIGFSVKRDHKKKKYITLMKVALLDSKTDNNVKQLHVSATYGQFNEKNNSVILRSEDDIKFSDPIDLVTNDDYSFDLKKNKLYKQDNVIEGIRILNEFYEMHRRSTRRYRGLWLRIRMRFWRAIVPKVFDKLSSLANATLYLVSGKRISYHPVFPEEYEYTEGSSALSAPKPIPSEGNTINLFGYEASRHSVLFYAMIHFAAYVAFSAIDYRPYTITTIFKTSFLTVVYVVLSLWFVEAILPKILSKAVRSAANLSFNSRFRKIKVRI